MNSQELSIKNGDAIIVPTGTKHNVINTSSEKPLKLYTLYSPPHHKDGVIHKTKTAQFLRLGQTTCGIFLVWKFVASFVSSTTA